jgi:hypothetical protein
MCHFRIHASQQFRRDRVSIFERSGPQIELPLGFLHSRRQPTRSLGQDGRPRSVPAKTRFAHRAAPRHSNRAWELTRRAPAMRSHFLRTIARVRCHQPPRRHAIASANSRGSISVGLDGSPERGDRSIVVPEVRLGDTRLCHPIIRFAVARRKAERLQYMGLGFLGSTGKTLAETDPSVSWGQILIELQRLRGTRRSRREVGRN